MSKSVSLKSKTIKGLFWTFSDLILNQGIQFIIQIFLARLLMPEEFGLIGMITVFIAISNSIIDSGFSNALIREPNPTEEDYSTVFYFNMAMSVVIYFVLYISAPYISKFYNQEIIIPILRVLGITVIINSIGIIQKTLLVRKIDFKTQTVINIICSVTSGSIAIWVAYKGFGIWSLVVRSLVMQMLQALLLFAFNRWLPKFVFKVDSFKRLFGFGWKVLVSGLIDTIYQNVYYLVIGKFYSPKELGYYTNAQKLRDMSSLSITTSIQKVSYPVLSNIQEENEKLKSGYRKIIKNSVYISFPVMIGLVIVANSFINLIFGEKWIPSIIYFQLLCIEGMLFPLHVINLNILQVKGRSDLYLKVELIKKIISIISISIALFLGVNIKGLLFVAIINSNIAFVINSYYSARIISYPTLEQIKDILPVLFASILMGIVAYFAGKFINVNIFLKLIFQALIGIVSYMCISKLFCKEEFNTIYEMLKSLLQKRKKQ